MGKEVPRRWWNIWGKHLYQTLGIIRRLRTANSRKNAILFFLYWSRSKFGLRKYALPGTTTHWFWTTKLGQKNQQSWFTFRNSHSLPILQRQHSGNSWKRPKLDSEFICSGWNKPQRKTQITFRRALWLQQKSRKHFHAETGL